MLLHAEIDKNCNKNITYPFRVSNWYWCSNNYYFLSRRNAAASSSIEVKYENVKVSDTDIADEDWDESYACGYCEQVFTNSTDLMEHRETHTELNEEHTKYLEDSC